MGIRDWFRKDDEQTQLPGQSTPIGFSDFHDAYDVLTKIVKGTDDSDLAHQRVFARYSQLDERDQERYADEKTAVVTACAHAQEEVFGNKVYRAIADRLYDSSTHKTMTDLIQERQIAADAAAQSSQAVCHKARTKLVRAREMESNLKSKLFQAELHGSHDQVQTITKNLNKVQQNIRAIESNLDQHQKPAADARRLVEQSQQTLGEMQTYPMLFSGVGGTVYIRDMTEVVNGHISNIRTATQKLLKNIEIAEISAAEDRDLEAVEQMGDAAKDIVAHIYGVQHVK